MFVAFIYVVIFESSGFADKKDCTDLFLKGYNLNLAIL